MNAPAPVALAGQPNCGKSTIFNMLTGARQHVANYPGVTVEKKTGRLNLTPEKHLELVDLPGTYSLTSYSLEERVARDFLLRSHPSAVINVVDAANLKRNLYLTLQLLEMELPLVIALNMMDVAERRSITIDYAGLAAHLQTPVIPTTGRAAKGADGLKNALLEMAAPGQGEKKQRFRLDYGPLESFLEELEGGLAGSGSLPAICAPRWLAVKLLEGDAEASALLREYAENSGPLQERAEALREEFRQKTGLAPERHIAFTRHRVAASIFQRFADKPENQGTLSDKADRVICHRIFGPLILLGVLFIVYQVSIVFGGYLAARIWPFWADLQSFFAGYLPAPGFARDPAMRSLGLWVMKSMTAILNYLPIFFLLFSLITILEDSGYMPRMAFILDRLFRRFGLHGQSTLPLILGGVYVGGCAIPAVMATRAIPDEKARLATILIAPMMNCLAKVPLYLILIGAYFAENSGLAMFFIATVTLFMALPVAKIISITILRGKQRAPFIMEMPPYHLPTARMVLSRSFERIWIFLKKIVTMVLGVSIVVFALISFPDLDAGRLSHYEAQAEKAGLAFAAAASETRYAEAVSAADLHPLLLFEQAMKEAKRGVTDQDEATAIEQRFALGNPLYYEIVRGEKGEDANKLRRALKNASSLSKRLRREMREETFSGSALGRCGKALEPVTKYAGFTWKINTALLSALAAKENSAATLGAIYGLDQDEGSVQENMKNAETGFGPLHALALMIFMALYPPCVPAAIMVRLQAGASRWMLFSIAYQTCLGLLAAIAIFSGGSALGLSGWQAMWLFYGLCIALTVATGLLPEPKLSSGTRADAAKSPAPAESNRLTA